MGEKRTEGPWHYDWTSKRNGIIQGYVVGPAKGPLDELDHIEAVAFVDNDTDDAEDIARLIASAPALKAENERLKAINAELLEALRGFVMEGFSLNDVGKRTDPATLRQITKARAAIAKARGEG